MFFGLTRLVSKIEWYFKFSLKNKRTLYTGCCCLNCKFYDKCRQEQEQLETVFGEVVDN